MRIRVAVSLLALTLLALPIPTVHAADGPTAIADDVAGDVKLDANGNPQATPTPVYPGIDLKSLTVTESTLDFRFVVTVADIKTGQDDAGDDGSLIYTQFLHADRWFRITTVHEYLPGLGEFSGAGLEFRDSDSGPWNAVWFRPDAVALDAGAETYTVVVPRGDLADSKGAAPYPGRTLGQFSVQSENLLGQGNFIQAFGQQVASPGRFFDAMPDSGPAPATFAVQFGLSQDGHARLTSDEPFRASNGEATTFIFKVKGANTGSAADTFQLRATRVPSGWSVILPEPTLDLEAGADLEVPVLVTVPFNHVHGAAMSLVLEMPSTSDPGTVGRIEIGVRYLAIPQPAGHHNTIYFHSRSYGQNAAVFGTVFAGNDGAPFMNALETYDGDAGIPLSPSSSNFDVEGNQPYADWTWCVSLDPGLQMGLDFDMGGQKGHLKVPVHTVAPLDGTYLTADLLLLPAGTDPTYGCYFGGSPIMLGSLNATAPVSIAPNSDQVLEGDMDVWHAADRIPYTKGQTIAVLVHVHGVAAPDFLAASEPRLIPGGQVTLPLLEYHDDVKGVLTTLRGPGLTPLGPQDRLANPGTTVLFPISVANDGDAERAIDFNLTGGNKGWAQLPAGGAVLVPAHGTARADIVVRVPDDAKDGDVADLVLQAFDQANATSRGLLRLVVSVDTKETHDDDAGAVPQSDPVKKSPAWAPLGVVGVLALVALARRRDL